MQSVVPQAISGKKDETQDLGTIKDADGNMLSENIIEAAKEDGQTWTKTVVVLKFLALRHQKFNIFVLFTLIYNF